MYAAGKLASSSVLLSTALKNLPTALAHICVNGCSTSLQQSTPSSSHQPLRAPHPVVPSYRHFFSGAEGTNKKYNERRLIGYSPEQLYDIVSKVEEYQEFVPWCQKSRILKRSGDDYFEAELEVGFQVFVERYTSQVTLQHPKMVKSAVADSTLFQHLDSTWSLQQGPAANTCWLQFHVDFSFRSQLYRHIADVFFAEVVQRMMGAFEKRCAVKYGQSSLLNRRPVVSQRQHNVRQVQPATSTATTKIS